MAEIVETVVAELPGVNYKIISVTATIASASDTIVLTQAETGIQSIAGIIGAGLTAGMDAACTFLQVSASAMTITIVSKKETGAAADDFTGTTVRVSVLGTM